MPRAKANRRLTVPPAVAAVVRPVATRLSRMEDLLIEMRHEQDIHLKKMGLLQLQVETLYDPLFAKKRARRD